MKKVLSILLAISTLIVFSCFATSCTNSKPADKPDETTSAQDNPTDAGKSGNVLILKPNADDTYGDAAGAKLAEEGYTVTYKTFDEAYASGLSFDGVDLFINACGSLYVQDTMPALKEYSEAGGAILTLGGEPFTERGYLVGGKYVTDDDILESGTVIEDFDDESVLDKITSKIDKTGDYKTELKIEDCGSGYGNSFTAHIDFFKWANFHTMDIDLTGFNAIAMRMVQNITSYTTLLVLTDNDGVQWMYTVFTKVKAERWETYIVTEEDFVRVDGAEGTLDFDNVKTFGFGFDRNVSQDLSSALDVIIKIDRIVGFNLEMKNLVLENITASDSSLLLTAPPIFRRDYYFDYNMKTVASAVPTYGSSDASLAISGDSFVFSHTDAEIGDYYTRFTGILSAADNSDEFVAWFGIRNGVTPVAAFGINDSEFYKGAGVEYVIDAADKLLSKSYITEVPMAVDYYDDGAVYSLDVNAISKESGAKVKIVAGDIQSETDAGKTTLEIPGTVGAKTDVIVTLEKDGTVLDTAKFVINYYNSPVEIVVTCVGDSLTDSWCASEGMKYPEQLGRINGPVKIISSGYGAGGTTCTKVVGSPFRNIATLWDESHTGSPDYVIILFANNEACCWGSCKDIFYEEYLDFALTYENLESKPKIILGLPIPRLVTRNIINITENEVAPLIEKLAADRGWETVRLYDVLEGKEYYMCETIHPNDRGYGVMAHAFYDKIVEMVEAETK